MKINEVEQKVGITKRNIRFYEKEGLLNPARNNENGYRDYSEEDIVVLKQVKLFRKLSVPLEEIRRVRSGELTVTQGLRQHIVALKQNQSDLEHMQSLCEHILEDEPTLPHLDVDAYLNRMEQMEKEGTKFVDIKKKDSGKFLGASAAAVICIAFLGLMLGILGWAVVAMLKDPEVPVLVVVLMAAVGLLLVSCMLAILVALLRRMREIKGGEEDAAAQY